MTLEKKMSKTKKTKFSGSDNESHENSPDDSPDDFDLDVWHTDNHIFFYASIKTKNFKSLRRIVHFLIKRYEKNLITHKLEVLKINNSTCSKEQKRLKILLINLKKKDNRIFIHFNSTGGVVHVGLQMYYFLEEVSRKMEVHTINEAECHSSATLPFLAGKYRTAFPHAVFLIHEVSYIQDGALSRHSLELERALKDSQDMAEIYLKHLNIEDVSELNAFLKLDKHLSIEDATKLGFLT